MSKPLSSKEETRMNLHANARTCPNSRALLVKRILEQHWSLTTAAEAAGVSERTAAKWVRRFREEGPGGLGDRSSRPRRSPRALPVERVEAILALRRVRLTGEEIASVLGHAAATVSAVLRRHGLGKRSALDPLEPPNPYERSQPGELLHIDVKKLGRIDRPGHRATGTRAGRRQGAGWEFVHVCVDDATRLAYVEVLPDERAITCVAFLRRAVGFYRRHGVRVERVMTDNGPGYVSVLHALCCRGLGLRHLRTRPYRPRTNGKAERFIQTLTQGWAYGAIYGSSGERTRALEGWLERYNFRRPHGSLSHQPPGARLAVLMNNVSGVHT